MATVSASAPQATAGERQQIGLARALLRRPSLLLLDEATCSLDADSERRLLVNLTSLALRPTILLISHRAESFAPCDRIITLADGQLNSDRRDT
jgi:ABC-type transport system involved in cytochrome bd biosynthesis fused ATPase/permease subunit